MALALFFCLKRIKDKFEIENGLTKEGIPLGIDVFSHEWFFWSVVNQREDREWQGNWKEYLWINQELIQYLFLIAVENGYNDNR